MNCKVTVLKLLPEAISNRMNELGYLRKHVIWQLRSKIIYTRIMSPLVVKKTTVTKSNCEDGKEREAADGTIHSRVQKIRHEFGFYGVGYL